MNLRHRYLNRLNELEAHSTAQMLVGFVMFEALMAVAPDQALAAQQKLDDIARTLGKSQNPQERAEGQAISDQRTHLGAGELIDASLEQTQRFLARLRRPRGDAAPE